MRITLLIVLGFLIIAGGGFYALMRTIGEDIERQYSQASEEPLVDFAHLFASLIERDVEDGKIDVRRFRESFTNAYRREFTARIYQLEKNEIQTQVYVTNQEGIVIFDSEDGMREGRDYSEFNDVFLARQGKYGVRASRVDEGDSRTTVFFIAAPIYAPDGAMVGTLSVSRPETAMAPFAEESRRLLLKASVITATVVLLLGAAWSYFVLSPIHTITRDALRVAKGDKATISPSGVGELRSLSLALEKMRIELEGKHYVENYVQALTHELKSPLAAIRGAAELIDEKMPEEKRERFLANILLETTRSEDLVRRLVQLASVESQTELEKKEDVVLSQLLKEEIAALKSVIEMKQLEIEVTGLDQGVSVEGDPLMLRIAVRNVLNNAFDFSSPGGVVEIELRETEGEPEVVVRDSGPGLPDYAVGRVFDRFYSLKNEVTGRKGSGIGLSFVRSTMLLHGGSADLENRPEGGAAMKLLFPAG